MIKRIILLTRPVRYYFDSLTYIRKNKINPLTKLKGANLSPMLIIGNGPSLNTTPLDRFIGITSIGMNKIDLLFDKVNWRPDLIICTNNLVVKQHYKKFIENEIPVYLSWKSRFFIEKKIRYKFSYFLSLPSQNFSKDITQGVGSAGTVTYSALQFAYYMGANPVILFGVDHSFRADGKSNEIERRKGEDINHFDPNYFKEGSFWGIPNLELSEIGYRLAKAAFESDGRRIYDATVNGQLDVFPKISVDEAKKLCNIS